MIAYPSILEKTPTELFSQIQKLSKYYSYFQIDIADGKFVHNNTVQIEEIIERVTYNVKRETLKKLSFEFHLMVKDYEKEIKKLLKLQKLMDIKTVLVHTSLFPKYQLLTKNHQHFSFGLVLNPEDSVNTIKTKYALNKIPIIQIMSVHPGAQGNPFIRESLQKIEQLRKANYRNKISLDGAVNDKTIPIILSQKYIPDIVCPGSFLTKAENLDERVSYLKEKIAV